jgi:protein O-mannosyl-transferase
MWTTFLLGHWVPVTWMTLGLDYLAWGLNPRGYHLTNVLLHSANAMVAYLIALRLLRAARSPNTSWELPAWRVGAAFAALLFALHPLRVESVAWITERRDVLSGLFYLLATLAYLRDAEASVEHGVQRRPWYWVSLGCFVLALLSKAITVTLPVVLIVLDLYPLRLLGGEAGGWWSPRSRRRLVEKVPFVAASVAVILVALVAARSGANLLTVAAFGVVDRLAVSVYGLTFYLWKTVAPIELSPFYAMKDPLAPFAVPFVVSALVVVLITALALLGRRRCPALGAVWIIYIVTLLPVSGVFQNGPQIAADRYTYLPSLPWAVLAGAVVAANWRRLRCDRRGRAIALGTTAAAACVLGVLVVLTWRQIGVWRDPERLWAHALAIAPTYAAHEHLGYLRRQQGRMTEAVEHYQAASSLRPGAPDLLVQWGNALAAQGRLGEAVERYRDAVRIAPNAPAPHYHWGNALAAAGRADEALPHYREAVRIDPSYAEAYNSWGRLLAQRGKTDEAIEKYREALRVQPHSVPHYNWGNALFAAGRLDEAIVHYREDVRIDPSAAEAYNNWGRALAQQDKWEEAIDKYREALHLRPDYALAAANLRQALSRVGGSTR